MKIMALYISLMPVILGGIWNMMWCKTNFFPVLQKPLDNGALWFDGDPLLGANKTWKGFLGIVVWTCLATILWGFCCKQPFLLKNNLLYQHFQNTLGYNFMMGLSFGFAYALLELPNSFIKRRLQIPPGKSIKGILGFLFLCWDQIDSIIGCVLVLSFVCPMDFLFFLSAVCIGGFTHLILNQLLYICKLRRNRF